MRKRVWMMAVPLMILGLSACGEGGQEQAQEPAEQPPGVAETPGNEAEQATPPPTVTPAPGEPTTSQ